MATMAQIKRIKERRNKERKTLMQRIIKWLMK